MCPVQLLRTCAPFQLLRIVVLYFRMIRTALNNEEESMHHAMLWEI